MKFGREIIKTCFGVGFIAISILVFSMLWLSRSGYVNFSLVIPFRSIKSETGGIQIRKTFQLPHLKHVANRQLPIATLPGLQPPLFVTSMVIDHDKQIWVGSDGDGVFCYHPTSRTWTRFTSADGLGDNYAYAIACDLKGRIWVGHLNHSVSVYNGKTWRNYGDLAELPGERIYRITICPLDGDVWIATNGGITRYSQTDDVWRTYTEADGLPSSSVTSMAFDRKGNAIFGTECNGIVTASANDQYHKWHILDDPYSSQNHAPAGTGLPSDLINDILVARNGTVYVATDNGLAASNDACHTWHYWRGKDSAAKYRNGKDTDLLQPNGQSTSLLAEDYITCLAEDPNGILYIGHRYCGWEAFDMEKLIRVAGSASISHATVSALLPLTPRLPIFGTRGSGPIIRDYNPQTLLQGTISTTFPLPPSKPTLMDLNMALEYLDQVPPVLTSRPIIVSLPDDWRTQGTWLGRYGKYWVCACAMAGEDYLWGDGQNHISYTATIGTNHFPDDSKRYYVLSLYSNDIRYMEMPEIYLDSRIKRGLATGNETRRQSSWDDHGEAYPLTYEGPNLDCKITIPSGIFLLSLYEINPGPNGDGRLRDYKISIRLTPTPRSGQAAEDHLHATARVHDFCGGVYKRFLVGGPTEVSIEIDKNYSRNTLLSGLMLDPFDELPPPYFKTEQQWNTEILYDAYKRTQLLKARATRPVYSPEKSESEAARSLFNALNDIKLLNPIWFSTNGREIYRLLWRWESGRTSGLNQKEALEMARCCYELALYQEEEYYLQLAGMTTARQIEKSLRWDGVTDSYTDKEYSCVRAYLATIKHSH